MQQYTILELIGLFTSLGSFIYGLSKNNVSLIIFGSLMGFTFLIVLVICSNYFDNIKQPNYTGVKQ